eukprot:jgi/Tetstr1/441363/TSEL_029612.t1
MAEDRATAVPAALGRYRRSVAMDQGSHETDECLAALRGELRQLDADGAVEQLLSDAVDVGAAPLAPQLRHSFAAILQAERGTLAEADAYGMQALQQAAWEKLHSGYWRSVPVVWRELYALSCLLAAGSHLLQSEPSRGMAQALRELDMGAMMGGPRLASAVAAAAGACQMALQAPLAQQASLRGGEAARGQEEVTVSLPEGSLDAGNGRLVPCRTLPSLEEFLLEHMLAGEGGEPVVIEGGMAGWPAMSRWADLGYLKHQCGFRTVPVEVGEHYLADGWTQRLMTLSDFITRHVEGGCGDGERAYLAQHPLFDQIPALRADIMTPEYCSLGEGEMQAVNAWFGPSGTVSCLHHDPHHNLLAQVVGTKYVRLYAPEQTPNLYPHDGLNSNTSQVDLDHGDEGGRFPRFAGAAFREALLRPGQMLYIPPRWWHYVKSLSVSFSVSFWWR